MNNACDSRGGLRTGNFYAMCNKLFSEYRYIGECNPIRPGEYFYYASCFCFYQVDNSHDLIRETLKKVLLMKTEVYLIFQGVFVISQEVCSYLYGDFIQELDDKLANRYNQLLDFEDRSFSISNPPSESESQYRLDNWTGDVEPMSPRSIHSEIINFIHQPYQFEKSFSF